MRLLASCLGMFLLVAAPASAQSSPRRETAAARALFEEGVALSDRGELEQAEDRFRRSLAIRESSSVRFNLGTVIEQRGHLVEAHELFAELAVNPETPAELAALARARAEGLAPRLARLTLVIPDALRDATIRVDGLELSSAMLAVALPADPGRRHLTVRRGSTLLFERTIELREGERRRVDLVAGPEDAARSVAAADGLGAAGPTTSDGGDDAWIWIVVAAVVVAAIAGGIAIGWAVDQDRYYQGSAMPGRVGVP